MAKKKSSKKKKKSGKKKKAKNGSSSGSGSSSHGITNPVVAAVKADDFEAVEEALANGVDINATYSRKYTLLHTAAQCSSSRMVAVLVEQDGIDLNPRDKEGKTPLWKACSRGHVQVIGTLLAAGCDASIASKSDITPLFALLLHYDLPDVALGLIDAGCDVNMVPSGGKFEGVSVLRVAKKRRRMATVDMLENAGATDVSVSKKPKGKKKGSKGKKGKKSDDDSRRNYTPRGGDTIAFNAMHGSLSDVSGEGSDLDQWTKELDTPLVRAVVHDNVPAAKKMLEARANPNMSDMWRHTPLYHAAAAGSTQAVALLLKHKAVVDVGDESGTTALHAAIIAKESRTVRQLLAARADPQSRIYTGPNKGLNGLELAVDATSAILTAVKRAAEGEVPTMSSISGPGSSASGTVSSVSFSSTQQSGTTASSSS